MFLTESVSSLCSRKKHVSAILNIRGLTRQSERQEILNIVKDLESSEAAGGSMPTRERLLFHEVPVTSEVPCLNLGLSRVALSASACFTALRPRQRRGRKTSQETTEDGL